jgi:hypothetical protein
MANRHDREAIMKPFSEWWTIDLILLTSLVTAVIILAMVAFVLGGLPW